MNSNRKILHWISIAVLLLFVFFAIGSTATGSSTTSGDATTHFNRGNEYMDKRDYDQAIAEYSKAIQLNSNYFSAYINRGVAYYRKGDYDRAIANYDQGIQLNPNFAVAYNNRGTAYRAKGDYDKAIADYEAALLIDSTNALAKENLENARQATYLTGDGGKDISIAILEPTGTGLSADEQWMLSLIQGSITRDFSRYSAMTVVDRQELENQAQTSTANDSVSIGKLTNASHVLTGTLNKTRTGYTLELVVTDVETGERVYSYPAKPLTKAEVENLSATKAASSNLLEQMGVTLTAAGQEAIASTTPAQIQAETSLARGITAQRQGNEVTALVFLNQATAFSPSLTEAVSRSTIISANITSGNIGADVRNDIEWRRRWVAKLTETEEYFNTMFRTIDPPYTLFYSTGIQQGRINYQAETIELSFPINLRITSAWSSYLNSTVSVVRTVNSGLNATERRNVWELGNWPTRGVTNINPFDRRWQTNFTIVFELLNERSQVIGRQTASVSPTYRIYRDNNGQIHRESRENNFNTVTFDAVKAADISDSMTIRIVSVNGVAPENAKFQITALSDSKWQEYIRFDIEYGVIKGFSQRPPENLRQQYRNFIFPDVLWEEPAGITSIGGYQAFGSLRLTSVTIPNTVTTIGDRRAGSGPFLNNQLTSVSIPNSVTFIGDSAFAQNQLTSVIIPNSVTRIGSGAFSDNKLISITIPNSVTHIEGGAFSRNQLTSVTIPASVTNIGDNAFYGNSVTSITIGANVTLSESNVSGSFGIGFERFYNENSRQAGTYTFNNGRWSYRR